MEYTLPDEKTENFDEAWDSINTDPKEAKQEEEVVDPITNDPVKEKTPVSEPAKSEPAGGDELDYKELYEKEVQKTKSWEGRIRAANRATQEAQEEVARLRQENQELTKQADGRQQAASSGPTVEADDETLSAFLKEFPDLHAPLQALIRKEAKALVGTEIGSLKPELETLKASEAKRKADAAEKAKESHWTTLKTAHPDYRELVDNGKLDDWIATKPSITQPALLRVRNEGNAGEVIEMFDLMKADLGMKSPQTANEPIGDKQKKLKAMVAVPGSSGGPPKAAPDRGDFDSAWDDANKK